MLIGGAGADAEHVVRHLDGRRRTVEPTPAGTA
jgi:hypothetical protein